MAEAGELAQRPGNASGVYAASNSARPMQGKALNLRLTPVNNSDQPVAANSSSIRLVLGMTYVNFGYIELGVPIALPCMVLRGDNVPDEISGKLAVRVVTGFDGSTILQRHVT